MSVTADRIKLAIRRQGFAWTDPPVGTELLATTLRFVRIRPMVFLRTDGNAV